MRGFVTRHTSTGPLGTSSGQKVAAAPQSGAAMLLKSMLGIDPAEIMQAAEGIKEAVLSFNNRLGLIENKINHIDVKVRALEVAMLGLRRETGAIYDIVRAPGKRTGLAGGNGAETPHPGNSGVVDGGTG